VATITIKNIPDDLYEELKAQAAANRRSINNEVIMIIERAFRSYKPSPEEVLARARKLRDLTAHYVITAEEVEQWVNEGRE
jgi:plasmid stability protein